MIRIAVLGDIDSIKGFGAVGLDVFPCTDQQSAHDSFKKITGSGNYGVLFITGDNTHTRHQGKQRYRCRTP